MDILMALSHASILVGDCSNKEYARGICEILASLFPIEDMDTEERAEEVFSILDKASQ